MAASIEEIARQIVELPRHQRLVLVRLLLDLDEQAWDDEIRARVKAVDEGCATCIPYEQIKKEMASLAAEQFRRLKGDVAGEALIEAMHASPNRDVEIAPSRTPLPVRDVPL